MYQKLLPIVFTVLFSCVSLKAGNSVNNGGDIIDDILASTDQIEDTLDYTRRSLYSFILSLEFLHDIKGYEYLKKPEYEKILNHRSSFLKELENVYIHSEFERPCIDSDGVESDGSAFGLSDSEFAEFHVCISVFRLNKKLTFDNYRQQLLGLVAHEISHRIGYTEAEANALQRALVQDFRKMLFENSPGTSFNYYWPNQQDYVDNYNYIVAALMHVQDAYINVHKYSDNDLSLAISLMTDHLYKYNWFQINKPFYDFRLFSREEQYSIMVSRMKQYSARHSLCILYKDTLVSLAKSKCNVFSETPHFEIFNGLAEISSNDFNNRKGQFNFEDQIGIDFPGKIRRIETRIQLELELADILDRVKFMYNRFYMLKEMYH